MGTGSVEMLLILGGNPVYTAPADLDFGRALLDFAGVRNPDGSLRHFTVHLSLYDDETSYVCQWRLPCSHFLESWGDVRAYDGTVSDHSAADCAAVSIEDGPRGAGPAAGGALT